MPTYEERLTQSGVTTRGWYTFWAGLWKGQPTGQESVVTVGTSPFSYVAQQAGTVILSGGSTTSVKFSRDGNNFYLTGVTAGMFPVSQGDTLQITYPGALPTMVFVPR